MTYVLTELYEMQDETIEHKLPNYNGKISYFIEASGDCFRELCKDPVDFGGYIAEKRMKLRKFHTLDVDDIKYIMGTKIEHPDWHEELDKYIMKVNELGKITEKYDYGVYEKAEVYGRTGKGKFVNRKERMVRALEVIIAICFYAKEEMTRNDASKIVKSLDDMLD